MNPTRSVCLWLALIIFAGQPAMAQHHGGDPKQGHLPDGPSVTVVPSPYAGMENRRVKALSDQQIVDLKAGRGMSLALAAELNGYPGPLHALELGSVLNRVLVGGQL